MRTDIYLFGACSKGQHTTLRIFESINSLYTLYYSAVDVRESRDYIVVADITQSSTFYFADILSDGQTSLSFAFTSFDGHGLDVKSPR